LRDDRLQLDLMQMSDLIEQITGRPLGRRYTFSGDENVDLDEAMDVLGDLRGVDDLERQLREALRNLDFDRVDRDLLQDLLGPEANAALEEMRRIATLLQDEGLA